MGTLLWMVVLVIVANLALVIIIDQICNVINNNKRCFMCWGSKKCKNCIFCINSDHCYECYKCRNCEKCSFCNNCILCKRCTECIRCIKCKRSHWCEECEKSQRLINCDFCTDCFECKRCISCIDCRNICVIKARPGRKLSFICGDDCSKCQMYYHKCKYVPMHRAEKIIEKY